MSGHKDRTIQAALDAQKALEKHQRILDAARLPQQYAALDALRHFHESSGVQRMLADIERNQTMMRMVAGPLEDLRRSGLLEGVGALGNDMAFAGRALADIQSRFRLPDIAEKARLIAGFDTTISVTLARYAEAGSSIQRAIERMQTPWLDKFESIRSLGGFAALQGIGHALKDMPAFGHDLGAALRIDLGDWRDTITWPAEIFTDYSARSNFYVSRGFNPALTDFPSPAFEESLDIAELRREPPGLVDLYGSPIPAADDDDEEKGFARTNTAHDWLLRLETQVRRFIDALMTEAFGADWAKHRLPNGLYDKWDDKRRKALQSGGRELTLIAYADFTDYILIIGKRDNWQVFEPYFVRQEDVRESFQRLHPIRLDTMHARPITQDDELLLYVETRRLIKVISKKLQ